MGAGVAAAATGSGGGPATSEGDTTSADRMHTHMGEVPEAEPHRNTHMNEMTEVEQPDRKRQRGPRGVRGQGQRTGRARTERLTGHLRGCAPPLSDLCVPYGRVPQDGTGR